MERTALDTTRVFGVERFTKKIVFQRGKSVAFVLNFMPGQSLPPHGHPGTCVYILMLEGSGTLTVDGTKSEINRADAICCEGTEQIAFDNTGDEPARLYVVLNKLPDARYAEEVHA